MNTQRLVVSVGGRPQFECSIAEFLQANGDCMEPEQIDELNAAISRGETYTGGGGAQPSFEIRIA